jgi:crotonobetainyl-CoA:carnitine CoA-transferase CaiB-like acyl-CoA transferase
MVGFAMAGLMSRSGRPERPPLVAPGNLAYDVTGIAAAHATLLGFYQRLRTGRGQHIDVSVFEAVSNLSDGSLPGFSVNPTVVHRTGAGVYPLYRCADGWVRMIILVPGHWRALMTWMDHPEELADPAYEQFVHRLMHMDKVNAVIERFLADKPKIDAAKEAQRRGITATPLLLPSEVLDNEHTTARVTFVRTPVGGGIEARLPSGLLTVDGERSGPTCGPPELGELGDGSWSEDRRERVAAMAVAAPGPAMDGYPLRGLRVIDFGVGAVGVEVGRLFAEYGADVIKVETRRAPDFYRAIFGNYMNPNFASSNRTKRSFGVDLKTERGIALVRRLVQVADVFIENNGTAVTERLGFGPAALRELNPRIVSFSSQLAGSAGPWKDWTGYGPNTHPLAGLQYLWNYPEDADRPAGSTNMYPDHFVGRVGAVTVLAGLINRLVTGVGSHHDAAQFEVALGLIGDLLAEEDLSPGSVGPQGNASARGAPWGCYPCAGDDEWCVINVREDREWRSFVGAMGSPSWADDRFATATSRLAHREEIDRGVARWTTTLDASVVFAIVQAVGVPAGIVTNGGHLLGDPQLAHRGYAKVVDQQGVGTMMMEGPAFLGTDIPEPIVTQAPWIGEHTREIARDLLGLTASDIEQLVADGVLEDPPEVFVPPPPSR